MSIPSKKHQRKSGRSNRKPGRNGETGTGGTDGRMKRRTGDGENRRREKNYFSLHRFPDSPFPRFLFSDSPILAFSVAGYAAFGNVADSPAACSALRRA